MANRRFAVHEIPHILARMRLGESDREIAKARLMGRIILEPLSFWFLEADATTWE